MELGLNIIQGASYIFILSLYFIIALGASIALILASRYEKRTKPWDDRWWVWLIFLPIPGIPLLFMIFMGLVTIFVFVLGVLI